MSNEKRDKMIRLARKAMAIGSNLEAILEDRHHIAPEVAGELAEQLRQEFARLLHEIQAVADEE